MAIEPISIPIYKWNNICPFWAIWIQTFHKNIELKHNFLLSIFRSVSASYSVLKLNIHKAIFFCTFSFTAVFLLVSYFCDKDLWFITPMHSSTLSLSHVSLFVTFVFVLMPFRTWTESREREKTVFIRQFTGGGNCLLCLTAYVCIDRSNHSSSEPHHCVIEMLD